MSFFLMFDHLMDTKWYLVLTTLRFWHILWGRGGICFVCVRVVTVYEIGAHCGFRDGERRRGCERRRGTLR